jgi:hypothetical protein
LETIDERRRAAQAGGRKLGGRRREFAAIKADVTRGEAKHEPAFAATDQVMAQRRDS